MRDRLEDLGRLREKISSAVEHEAFKILGRNGCRRPKDFIDCFRLLSKDMQDDLLHDLAYALDGLESELWDCYGIAKGDSDDE